MKGIRTFAVASVAALFLVFSTFGYVLAATGTGTLAITDSAASSDTLTLTMSKVSAPPAGKAYEGWLVSDDGKKLTNIGVIKVGADGSVNQTFTSPTKENLIGLYKRLAITEEPTTGTAAKPSKTVAFSHTIPSAAATHIRHIVYQWDGSPGKKGFAVGMKEQGKLAETHARLALADAKAGNLAGAKTHAEHIVNIIEGSKGKNYGDLNKDGKIDNPGDGIGVLVYATDADKHAGFASTGLAATTLVVLNSKTVNTEYVAATEQFSKARDQALQVLLQPSALAAEVLSTTMVDSASRGVKNADALYVAAQKMATYEIAPAKPGELPETGDEVTLILLAAITGGLILIGTGSLILRRRPV